MYSVQTLCTHAQLHITLTWSPYLFKKMGNVGAMSTTTLSIVYIYRFVVLIDQKLFQVAMKGKLNGFYFLKVLFRTCVRIHML